MGKRQKEDHLVTYLLFDIIQFRYILNKYNKKKKAQVIPQSICKIQTTVGDEDYFLIVDRWDEII